MIFGPKQQSQPVVGKASAVIKCPIEEVYSFIGDGFFENYPKWSPEVVELKSLSNGPLSVGTMARQVRVDHGHKSQSTFKVTQLVRNKKLSFSGVSNSYNCTYEFEETSEGSSSTNVSFTFELPELEMFMRPFEKLVRIAVQDGAVRTVKNLKGLLETKK